MSALRTHGDVWRSFKQSSDARRVTIAEHLDRLRIFRNAADYDTVLPADPVVNARDGVDLATAALRLLDEVRLTPG